MAGFRGRSNFYQPSSRTGRFLPDPDAAAELLQDRGLLLFWKWLEAWAFGDVQRLLKLATTKAVEGFGADIDRMKQRGDTFVVKLPAVGGTRIAAVETATARLTALASS